MERDLIFVSEAREYNPELPTVYMLEETTGMYEDSIYSHPVRLYKDIEKAKDFIMAEEEWRDNVRDNAIMNEWDYYNEGLDQKTEYPYFETLSAEFRTYVLECRYGPGFNDDELQDEDYEDIDPESNPDEFVKWCIETKNIPENIAQATIDYWTEKQSEMSRYNTTYSIYKMNEPID